jgi:hypothetical protein
VNVVSGRLIGVTCSSEPDKKPFRDKTRNKLFEIQPSALAELSKGCTARTESAQGLGPLRPDDVSQHADPFDLELDNVARLQPAAVAVLEDAAGADRA